MKKITKIKAMFIALMMLLGLIAPVTATAQKSDGFFRGGNDNYQNRDASINDEGGISNYGIGEEVPLGSGLLILTAVGAGYAISRRKRSRKDASNASNIALLSLALILGITSCKKNVETISSAATEGVFITLDVDSGSKVIVNPTGHTDPNYATVTFENGDIIYVGNNGKYCGYLEHNGTNFSGTITPESEADYLHFYFMGNKGAKSKPTSVSITDQTSKYPVISYAHSKTFYNSEVSTYTAKLQNYCAIVRFTTTNINLPITIEGMNNTITVNFAANNAATSTTGEPYAFSKTGDGEITLHAESSTERWAILLPQGAVTTAMAYADGYVSNSTFTVPAIAANTYHSTGIAVAMTDVRFSVGESTKVLFAPGNLQAVYAAANTSTCTWQFAPTQYSFIGNNIANTAVRNNQVDTPGTVDLFGWVGTTSDLAAYGINSNNTYSDYGNTANEAIKSDWCVVANAANLGGHNDWHTPTYAEWYYLFNTRTNASQKYGMGQVNGVNGLVILPDTWTLPADLSFSPGKKSYTTNSYTIADWQKMEKNGAVFLPAAGRRVTNGLQDTAYGFYWSSTAWTSNGYYAYDIIFQQYESISVSYNYRSYGHLVRLVRTVN